MSLFLIIVFGIYFLLLVALIVGWQISAKQTDTVKTSTRLSISVIIPFRNEANHLPALMMDLTAQNSLSEVLFIDDHSTDNSMEVLKTSIQDPSRFKIISLPEGWIGKKRAIHYGIQTATGDIIVTTDADCQLPRTWLTSIQRIFQNEKMQLVFGGVKIRPQESAFSKLQSLEFSSLIGSGAATLGLGFPTMCNGANLAYRKSAFLNVRGFEGNLDIPSGDDEFLMRKVHEKYPGGISFLNDKSAVVSTYAQATLKDFVNQRLRWAGKWKHSQSMRSKLLALFVFLFHTTFVVFIGLTIGGKVDVFFALMMMSGKILLEFVFLVRVNSFLNQPVQPIYFLVLQFVHPLYVIVIGFLSQVGKYSWKGRSLTNKL